MKIIPAIAISLLLSSLAFTQTVQIPLTADQWKFAANAKFQFEEFDGKQTLFLNGRAEATQHSIADGIIEVEVYANQKRSFAGISFRQQGNTMDEVYLRMHKSRQVDAIQYTPIFNGESNWQLYRELQANAAFKTEGWNQFKIVVKGLEANIIVNDRELLKVDLLRSGNGQGTLGLFGLFGNRFANFRYTPTDPVSYDSNPTSEVPEGVIGTWHISEAKTFKAQSMSDLLASLPDSYQKARTEASGLLPISKYVSKPSKGAFEQNSEDFIVAKLEVNADQKQTVAFTFDYSDRILLFLNKEIEFQGNNAFRAKGLQHTGHLGLDVNTIYLNLKKGRNTIHCVLIERGNGWGLMGKFNSMEGIRLMN